MKAGTILEGRALEKSFPLRRGAFKRISGRVRALEGFDFDLEPGETLGIVGESGCGKSTLGRVIARLYPAGGSLEYRDRSGAAYDMLAPGLSRARILAYRRDVQMIFQDPFSSLDPRMSVDGILREPLEVHGLYPGRPERGAYVASLLEEVGLDADCLERYPHEFSGGQRQRIAIARAIALKPRVLVSDEPTSALDVSVQSQVVNLLMDLQERESLAYVFISHNLDLVRHVSGRMIVMYLGVVMEEGKSSDLFDRPAHPYTKALMASIPSWDPADKRMLSLELVGEPPSSIDLPPGCPFAGRCPVAEARCREEGPALRELGAGRRAACHFA